MNDTPTIDLDKLWEIINNYSLLINKIQSALGTNECGDNLIEVARNAHRAEMELASTYNWDDKT